MLDGMTAATVAERVAHLTAQLRALQNSYENASWQMGPQYRAQIEELRLAIADATRLHVVETMLSHAWSAPTLPEPDDVRRDRQDRVRGYVHQLATAFVFPVRPDE